MTIDQELIDGVLSWYRIQKKMQAVNGSAGEIATAIIIASEADKLLEDAIAGYLKAKELQ